MFHRLHPWVNYWCFHCVNGRVLLALLTGIVASAFSTQMARREAIFEEEIKLAMSDGIITAEEENT